MRGDFEHLDGVHWQHNKNRFQEVLVAEIEFVIEMLDIGRKVRRFEEAVGVWNAAVFDWGLPYSY